MGSRQSRPEQVVPGIVSFSTPETTPKEGSKKDETQEQEVKQQNESQEKKSECPMHKGDGTYSFNLGALFGSAKSPHFPGGSKPLSKEQVEDLTKESKSKDAAAPKAGGGGGCPVVHDTAKSQAPSSEGPSSGCPVVKDTNQTEYNVYSQPIDPNNNMPAVANQLPAPGQTEKLSTERVNSTIPKGGTDGGVTWTYPSPQMFYNALVRKNKLGETTEEDIETVVALHNNMNESTWAKVLEWEDTLHTKDGAPKLLKFMGRPKDLSPKARFKHYVLGHPLPYDRHDWTIQRDDGTTVRYVIDYYHDESQTVEQAMPDMHDRTAVPCLVVDVRPALDSPLSLWGRALSMPYARHVAKNTPFEPLPLSPSADMKSQVGESLKVWETIQQSGKSQESLEVREQENSMSREEAAQVAESFAKMLTNCREAQQDMDRCESDEEYARASIMLTLCMAKLVCPLQHEALATNLHADVKSEEEYEARVEAALENATACVQGTSARASQARSMYPDLFQK